MIIMKKSLLVIFAAVLFMATQTELARAIPWQGNVTTGGNTYNNIYEFDWDHGPKYIYGSQTIDFTDVVLSALIGDTYEGGPFDSVTLAVSFINNGLLDDTFTIRDNAVVIAQGTFSETLSFIDDDNSAYWLSGFVTYFDPAAFSSGIGGFNLIGTQGFDESVDLSSTFTAVPEPSTMTLAGLGLACLFRAVRRKREN